MPSQSRYVTKSGYIHTVHDIQFEALACRHFESSRVRATDQAGWENAEKLLEAMP